MVRHINTNCAQQSTVNLYILYDILQYCYHYAKQQEGIVIVYVKTAIYCRWGHVFPKCLTAVHCILTVQLAGYTHTQKVSDGIVAIIYTSL